MLGLDLSMGSAALRRHRSATAAAPWSISALGSALGLYATGKRAPRVSGTVPFLPSHGGGIGAYATASANMATRATDIVVFDGTTDNYVQALTPRYCGDAASAAVTLPDVATSVAGKGPTCTGLARSSDGTWWVGDDGRGRQDDGNTTTFPSGVIHYSADFSTVLLDVRCSALGLGTSLSVQGVACLSGHGQVAFSHCTSSSLSSKVEIIDEATGAYVGSAFGGATITGLNGLAYDASLDAFIVHTVSGSVSTATWYARTAVDLSAPIKSCTLTGGSDADHLHYDGARGWLWWSVGANGDDARLYARALTDITTDIVVFGARGAVAIEGLVVTASEIVVVSDAYYHIRTPNLNQALRYPMPAQLAVGAAAATYPTGSRICAWAIVKLTAALTLSIPFWRVGGDPTTGASTGACGIYFVGAAGGVSNQIRAFMNAANVTWTLASGDFLTEKLVFVDFDMAAKTAELFVAGVSLGKQTFASGTATSLSAVAGYVGYNATRWFPGSLAAVGHAAGTAAQTTDLRQKIEGFMAWDNGRASLLDASHPYASAAP